MKVYVRVAPNHMDMYFKTPCVCPSGIVLNFFFIVHENFNFLVFLCKRFEVVSKGIPG